MPAMRALRTILDLVFPPRCVHCNTVGGSLCQKCLASIQTKDLMQCQLCGGSLSAENTCAHCCAVDSGTCLASLQSISEYGGAIRSAIVALKFRGNRGLAEPLGSVLSEFIRSTSIKPDVIVPVPLHAQRKRARGYNQVDLLARHTGKILRVQCRTDLLVRHRFTTPQVGLTKEQRLTNITGAFRLKRHAERFLAGKTVVLIDDVATTGSTIDEAARALAAGSPRAIHGITLARPQLFHHV